MQSFLAPPAPLRRAPSVSVNTAATTDTSASVAITPPAGTSAADYDRFVLSVCSAGNCLPPTDCAPSNIAACAITGLSPGQTYDITAATVKGSSTGPASPLFTLTTQHM